MSLSQLIGNERIKQWLKRAAETDRLPGALIFAGPEGVGKRAFAIEAAKALNCLQPASAMESCDQCIACRRITAGQFADLKIIAPDGQFIKIDQVREVVNEIFYRPFEGKRRIYIFESAERLREQAANALLKTLEEPPPGAMIILITASPDALLPTIRSRTALLRFAPLPWKKLIEYLAAHHPRPQSELNLLARLSLGSIGRALSIDLTQYQEQRKECLELLDLLLRQHQRARMIKAAEYFGRKERVEFEARLALFLSLLRDLICARLEQSDEIINLDISARLLDLAKASDIPQLAALSARLAQLERDLPRNINKQLALEDIFLSFGRQSAML
jgi:DNA polymerase-3 subunit delta'